MTVTIRRCYSCPRPDRKVRGIEDLLGVLQQVNDIEMTTNTGTVENYESACLTDGQVAM